MMRLILTSLVANVDCEIEKRRLRSHQIGQHVKAEQKAEGQPVQ